MLRRTPFARCVPAMSKDQVAAALTALPGWKPAANRAAIEKEYLFKDFHASWAFMSALVPYLNEKDHHPEWFNVYNKVQVTLATHTCNGVSEKDVALAKEMEKVAQDLPKA